MRILVVCTANICRSPAVEQLLRDRFGATSGITVASAGVRARDDDPIDPTMGRLLAEAGIAVDDEGSRALTVDLVRDADVILTATRRHRSRVVELEPAAVRKVFTLREFARLSAALDGADSPLDELVSPAERLGMILEQAEGHRSGVARELDDISDPYGQAESEYRQCFEQLRVVTDSIAATILDEPRPDSALLDALDSAADEETGPQNSRKRRRGRLALAISLGLLGLLAVTGVAGVFVAQAWLDRQVERFGDPFAELTDRPTYNAPESAEEVEPARPVTFLFLGSDSRISAGDPSQWEYGAQRTDAIMIAQLSAARDGITVMSIPRDSWVEIPGHGENKINAAFSFGGPSLTVATLEALLDAPIDHVVIADFESFAAVTDELGGVDISLSQPLRVGDRTYAEGVQHLDGDAALQYVRERKNVEGGDFGRVQRQQNWMRSIMSTVFQRDVLTSPSRLMGLLDTITESIAVDDSLSIGAMRDLALSARDIRPKDLRFITAPYEGTGRSPDGKQSIVVLDDERIDKIGEGFAHGTISMMLEDEPTLAGRGADALREHDNR